MYHFQLSCAVLKVWVSDQPVRTHSSYKLHMMHTHRSIKVWVLPLCAYGLGFDYRIVAISGQGLLVIFYGVFDVH